MQTKYIRAIFILLILTIPVPLKSHAQGENVISHIVQPGDTWIALAWQYGLDASQLKQQYGHINQQRQPTIGSTLLLPNTGIQRSGLIERPLGSVMKTAVSHNLTPWTIAQRNNLPTPYQSQLHKAVFVPIENQPVRELPIGFQQLEFSQVPTKPGQAIGLRSIVDDGQQIEVDLAGAEMDVFRNGRFLTALTGTGAFYGCR